MSNRSSSTGGDKIRRHVCKGSLNLEQQLSSGYEGPEIEEGERKKEKSKRKSEKEREREKEGERRERRVA